MTLDWQDLIKVRKDEGHSKGKPQNIKYSSQRKTYFITQEHYETLGKGARNQEHVAEGQS